MDEVADLSGGSYRKVGERVEERCEIQEKKQALYTEDTPPRPPNQVKSLFNSARHHITSVT